MEQQKLEKQNVEYCPVCTMPYEYCEYSKKSCSKENPKEEKDNKEEQKNENKQEKVNKNKMTITLYEKKNRGLTLLEGLQKQNIKSKDLAKILSSKLGCGAGSVKKDSLELQGFYRDILKETIMKEFSDLNISEDNFIVHEKIKKNSKKPKVIHQLKYI